MPWTTMVLTIKRKKESLANITRHLRLPSHDIFFPRFLAEKGDMTTKLDDEDMLLVEL